MEVSLRYTPVAGRLHTRYAPVRRSPAVYCYTPLPLDLHVLSLPLAFILSQDQTLHCKNCFCFTFDSSSCPASPPQAASPDTRYLCLLIRFYDLSPPSGRPPSRGSPPSEKRVQRYNHFTKRQNIFSKKIPATHARNCAPAIKRTKKIHARPSPATQGKPPGRPAPRKNPTNPHTRTPHHNTIHSRKTL